MPGGRFTLGPSDQKEAVGRGHELRIFYKTAESFLAFGQKTCYDKRKFYVLAHANDAFGTAHISAVLPVGCLQPASEAVVRHLSPKLSSVPG